MSGIGVAIFVAIGVFAWSPSTAYAVSEQECIAAGGTKQEHVGGLTGTTYTCNNPGKQYHGEQITFTTTDPSIKAETKARQDAMSDYKCSFPGFDLARCSVAVLNTVVFTPSGLFVGLAGVFLDSVITITIIDFAKFIRAEGADQGAITLAWSLVRDVLNMVFIFILLYLGIKTILGDSSYQKIIPRIVIAGLLINFSFFFTEVMIDLSNVLTVQFYDAIMRIGATAQSASDIPYTLNGLSAAFMNGLALRAPEDLSSVGNMLFQLIPSIITFLVAAFVFLVMGVMLLVRFIVLIILLITSPIAVMGDILPQLSKQSKQWWSTLSEQLIFAPAFMLFMLIVVLIINSAGFRNGVTVANAGPNASAVNGIMEFLLPYALAIGLMIAGLVISKQLAGSAGKGFTDWASKKAGTVAFGSSAWLGRKTVGRMGAAVADSGYLNAKAARGGLTGLLAQGAIGSGKWTGNASFDMRSVDAIGKTAGAGKAAEGFIKHREAEKKEYKDYMKKATMANPEISAAKQNLKNVKADARRVNEEASRLEKEGEIGAAELRAIQLQQHQRVEAAKKARRNVTTVKEARQNLTRASKSVSRGEVVQLRNIVSQADKEKTRNAEGKLVNLNDDQKKAWIQEQVAKTGNQRIIAYKRAMDLLGSVEKAAGEAQKAEQEKIVGEMAGYAKKSRFWRAVGAQDAADELRKELNKGKKDKFVEDAQKLFKEAGLGGDEGGGGGGEAKPKEEGGEGGGGGAAEAKAA